MLKSKRPRHDKTNHPSFFEHVACPHWGAGLLVWQDDGKCAYQFEDGKMRVFNESQSVRLRRIPRPNNGCASLLSVMNQRAFGHDSRRVVASFERLPLVKQCENFASRFPNGLGSVLDQDPEPLPLVPARVASGTLPVPLQVA